ncbi:MAG: hypothetical protein WCC67_18755, partial [Candidatus Acidiferrales bacterium]
DIQKPGERNGPSGEYHPNGDEGKRQHYQSEVKELQRTNDKSPPSFVHGGSLFYLIIYFIERCSLLMSSVKAAA